MNILFYRKVIHIARCRKFKLSVKISQKQHLDLLCSNKKTFNYIFARSLTSRHMEFL